MVPVAAEDRMGTSKEKASSWAACSLWRSPKDQAGRSQEVAVSALKFISHFSNLRDQHDHHFHSRWSLLACATARLLESWGRGRYHHRGEKLVGFDSQRAA